MCVFWKKERIFALVVDFLEVIPIGVYRVNADLRTSMLLMSLPFAKYLEELVPLSHENVSLAKMLGPFGFEGLCTEECDVPVGLILDDLQDGLKAGQAVDPFAVAGALWFFDCKAAGKFLDDGPYQIYCLLKEQMLSVGNS